MAHCQQNGAGQGRLCLNDLGVGGVGGGGGLGENVQLEALLGASCTLGRSWGKPAAGRPQTPRWGERGSWTGISAPMGCLSGYCHQGGGDDKGQRGL